MEVFPKWQSNHDSKVGGGKELGEEEKYRHQRKTTAGVMGQALLHDRTERGRGERIHNHGNKGEGLGAPK